MVSKRENEQFRENLIKSFETDLFTDARVMSGKSIGRMVDHEAINKCRLSRYAQESSLIKHMTQRTGDYDDMQRARDTLDVGKVDARYFDLEENLAVTYFNYYGQNYEGGDIIDDPTKYQCPGCHITMMMSWKTLPEECPRCHRITPLGELIRDRVIKR